MAFEFTKVHGNLVSDGPTMQVVLWDCGPPQPVAPARPKPPKGEEGSPDFDLAMVEFREQVADYERDLKAYRQAKIEYADFEKRYGGPFEMTMWSCDASDALNNDKRAVDEGRQSKLRYHISSRTRGYEKLKNRGLPFGETPGHGHEENLRRAAEGDADVAEQRRSDPVFGPLEARS